VGKSALAFRERSIARSGPGRPGRQCLPRAAETRESSRCPHHRNLGAAWLVEDTASSGIVTGSFRNRGRSTVFFDGAFPLARPWAGRIRGPVPKAFLHRPPARARRPEWWTVDNRCRAKRAGCRSPARLSAAFRRLRPFLAVMLRPHPPPACKKPRTNINPPVPRGVINGSVRSLIKKRAAFQFGNSGPLESPALSSGLRRARGSEGLSRSTSAGSLHPCRKAGAKGRRHRGTLGCPCSDWRT